MSQDTELLIQAAKIVQKDGTVLLGQQLLSYAPFSATVQSGLQPLLFVRTELTMMLKLALRNPLNVKNVLLDNFVKEEQLLVHVWLDIIVIQAQHQQQIVLNNAHQDFIVQILRIHIL